MSTTPNSIVTPQTPISGKCKLTAANTNYDTPTNAVQLLAGQTNGARITRVQAIPTATNSATDVQLYAYDGTNYRFIKAMGMGATTIGTTNVLTITPTDFGFSDYNPLYLAASEQLYAAISIANSGGISVRCEGGTY